MELKTSGEMYLETIYVLSLKKPAVHSVDVAEHMGFSKPSVSRGVGLLKKGGYISVAGDGCITLTQEGLLLARKIYERHTLIGEMLMSLGVDEKTAFADACRIEHVISDASFDAIKRRFLKG